MNKYVKSFFHRGLIFGGLGPIIVSIIFMCISHSDPNIGLSAKEMFMTTVSSYLLAFIQAGVSVFNQIEHWSVPKSLLCHFSLLYITYSLCYIVNAWIPFDIKVLVIFSIIFVVVYFVVWFAVYFAVKSTSKKLNEKL